MISAKTETTSLNTDEVIFSFQGCLQWYLVIAMNGILASPETETNSNSAITANSCLSPVHLKTEADPDPEKLWVF
jgi:hypothetical protein